MPSTAQTILILAAVGASAVAGCSKSPDAPSQPPATDHDHDGHDHEDGAPHDHAPAADPADDHHDERSIGSLSLGGTTLHVSIAGTVAPSSPLHVHIEHASGPIPAAIRLWVGDEDATGSMKTKADGGDGAYHAEADVPPQLPAGSRLWVEIETNEGDRVADSLPLEG